VQITFARSIDRILPTETHHLTPGIYGREGHQIRYWTLGRKHTIPYGLYLAHGYINPVFAAKTGFNEDDLSSCGRRSPICLRWTAPRRGAPCPHAALHLQTREQTGQRAGAAAFRVNQGRKEAGCGKPACFHRLYGDAFRSRLTAGRRYPRRRSGINPSQPRRNNMFTEEELLPALRSTASRLCETTLGVDPPGAAVGGEPFHRRGQTSHEKAHSSEIESGPMCWFGEPLPLRSFRSWHLRASRHCRVLTVRSYGAGCFHAAPQRALEAVSSGI